jgi:hypothetical protein
LLTVSLRACLLSSLSLTIERASESASLADCLFKRVS